MLTNKQEGSMGFEIEHIDDLWFLYNILLKGDKITTSV
jgi:stalled ribosome rescue protein Dom34